MGCPVDLVVSHLDIHLSVVGQAGHGDAGLLHGAQGRTDLSELQRGLGHQPLGEGRLQLQESSPRLLGPARVGGLADLEHGRIDGLAETTVEGGLVRRLGLLVRDRINLKDDGSHFVRF